LGVRVYSVSPLDVAWSILKQSQIPEGYRQAAGAIIRDAQGRILLMRRSPKETSMHGLYELPGGKLEEGETPEETARIEAMEESGLPLVNLQPLEPHIDHDMQKVYHGFVGEIDPEHQGDVVRSEEHDHHEWVHPEDMAQFEHPLSHHAQFLFGQM
tara:strand:+ start:1216 stop:1683 length:468 start_codon:yes stop_codon:yes gene_type:complete